MDFEFAEAAVILGQVLLGITVVAVVLLLPFLLVMAGVGTAMLLWFVASGAVLGALVFWLVFPGAYGLAVLLLILLIGLVLVDRRSRHGASWWMRARRPVACGRIAADRCHS